MCEHFCMTLKKFGLDDSTIEMIKNGDVGWSKGLDGKDLLLLCEGGISDRIPLTYEQIDELYNAHYFDSRENKSPHESAVFPPGELNDWAGVSPASDWEKMVDVYAQAADVLHKSIPNNSVEPYLFLCRHTFELALKGIIILGQQRSNPEGQEQLPDHHDLLKLWKAVIPTLQANGLSDADELNSVETVIMAYHKTDVGSYSFRYHVTRRNTQISREAIITRFHSSKHHELVGESLGSLYKVIENLKSDIALSKLFRKLVRPAKIE